MPTAESASASIKTIYARSRTLIIITLMASLTGTGVSLLASLAVAHYLPQADDLLYRQAAVNFVRLAIVMSAIGLVGLCGFFFALRPIARALVTAVARDRSEN